MDSDDRQYKGDQNEAADNVFYHEAGEVQYHSSEPITEEFNPLAIEAIPPLCCGSQSLQDHPLILFQPVKNISPVDPVSPTV